MNCSLGTHLLVEGTPAEELADHAPATVHDELRRLAFAADALPDLSRILYLRLREMLGTTRWRDWLRGVLDLAGRNEAAGARLLAALLNANVPAQRLIPSVVHLPNSQRMHPAMQVRSWLQYACWDWELRLHDLQARCEDLATESEAGTPGHAAAVPFSLLSRRLGALVATLRVGGRLAPAEASLLVDLLRLEIDAYGERIANLASRMDPFRRRTAWRVLPLLNRADAEIRDLRRLVGWIESGCSEQGFRERVPRFREVMGRRRQRTFRRDLAAAPELSVLAELHTAVLKNPLSIDRLAVGSCRLMALVHQLRLRGVGEAELSLPAAVRIVLLHSGRDVLHLPLDEELRQTIRDILARPSPVNLRESFPFEGCDLVQDSLRIRWPRPGVSVHSWPHYLPVPEDKADPAPIAPARTIEERTKPDEEDVRRLVLDSLDSETVLLGLLRNPLVTATPGLVGSIVVRCRSVRVLELIAQDRRLYSGFANQDVPLAVLNSPCNIPMRILRKFIHVKYVSRVDLQNLLLHQVALRKEVAVEIERYLESLHN